MQNSSHSPSKLEKSRRHRRKTGRSTTTVSWISTTRLTWSGLSSRKSIGCLGQNPFSTSYFSTLKDEKQGKVLNTDQIFWQLELLWTLESISATRVSFLSLSAQFNEPALIPSLRFDPRAPWFWATLWFTQINPTQFKRKLLKVNFQFQVEIWSRNFFTEEVFSIFCGKYIGGKQDKERGRDRERIGRDERVFDKSAHHPRSLDW